MATKKFKTDDAKFTGYGSIEIACGRFLQRLEKENRLEKTQPLKVIIEAAITYPINDCDEVGQEFNLKVEKVKFK